MYASYSLLATMLLRHSHSLLLTTRHSPLSPSRYLLAHRRTCSTGENYSLRHSAAHEWYTYPYMRSDECLVFKVRSARV